MVDIMEHLYQIPSIKYEESNICSTGEVVMKEKAKFNPILFGGDQLTAARAMSAMKADPPSVPKAPGQSRIFTSIFVP